MRDFEVCRKAALSGDVQAQFDLGDMNLSLNNG